MSMSDYQDYYAVRKGKLYRIAARPWGKDRLKTHQFTSVFDFSSILYRSQVYETPQQAVDAYRRQVITDLAACRERRVRLQAELDRPKNAGEWLIYNAEKE